MGIFRRNTDPRKRLRGTIRRTWGGKFQAYDNHGRKLGEPQNSEIEAVHAGAAAWTAPVGRPVRRGLW